VDILLAIFAISAWTSATIALGLLGRVQRRQEQLIAALRVIHPDLPLPPDPVTTAGGLVITGGWSAKALLALAVLFLGFVLVVGLSFASMPIWSD